jgi:hypothetical protein
MPSSGKWRHMALVRSDVSEERVTSIIRVKRIGELGTTLAITGELLTLFLARWFFALMMEVIRSSETSVHIGATWHHIPERIFIIVIAVMTSELTQKLILLLVIWCLVYWYQQMQKLWTSSLNTTMERQNIDRVQLRFINAVYQLGIRTQSYICSIE